MPIEAVNEELLNQVLPGLQSASSSSSVTLGTNETTANDVIKNREICFSNGYTAGVYQKVNTYCSCISSYNGTTKVATLSPALSTTLNAEYKYRIGGLCLNSLSGTVGSVTANVNAQVVGMNADTLTSSAVATSAAQEIGDTTLRRSSTNIEGSASGDTLGYKSLYGVIAQQTHKSNASLGVQSVYKADGTTVLNSRSYNSNPSAEPITGLD
jgi:hypothetical protein